VDLSHWTLIDYFDAREAACLAAGIEPLQAAADLPPVPAVIERAIVEADRTARRACASILASYRSAVIAGREIPVLPNLDQLPAGVCLISQQLRDAFDSALACAPNDGWAYLDALGRVREGTGKFHRADLRGFFAARGVAFEPIHFAPIKAVPPDGADAVVVGAPELQAANRAHHAVRAGYRDGQGSVKQRLLAYVSEHYPDLSDEAQMRVATVANFDKAAGRRKSAENGIGE